MGNQSKRGAVGQEDERNPRDQERAWEPRE